MAIDASREMAALAPAAQEDEEEKKMNERRLEEHKHRMEEIKIDVDPECEICMNIIVRPTQLPC